VLVVTRAPELGVGKFEAGKHDNYLDANINRSPTAYLANPEAERARYQFDQDKGLTVLRFNDAFGNARGLMSFFAVHGTSLYNLGSLGILKFQHADEFWIE
jgi:neutral ceramidase